MTNSKSTKRALVSSAFAILICAAMLIGTTFAWFTDTASTAVNKIQAGTLKVALEMKGEDGRWVDAEGKTLSFTNNYWEPGCTYSLPELRIRNDGNLALKYKVAITGIKGDAELNKVIEWTIDGMVIEHEYTLNAEATQNFTISGHMRKTAGNEYQGKKIDGISITVYATQATVEVDGTGSNQYDKDAEYSMAKVNNLDDLRNAINSPTVKNIVLADDIEITYGDVEVLTGYKQTTLFNVTEDTVIDLNGQTLQFNYDNTKDGYPVKGEPQCWYGFYVYNGATLTIIDSSNDNSGKVYSDDPVGTYAVCAVGNSTVNIYGGTFYSADGAAIYKNNGYVNIYGGVFETAKHKEQLLNEGNKYRDYGPFMIYGGSFKSFEPGVTNSPVTKVADGYKVINDGDWYTVVPITETKVTADTTFDMAGQTIALDDVDEAYVMTSDNSGAKIILKNATYTGDAQGIFFGNYIFGSSDYKFNTQADNVTVKNLNVSTNISNGNNKLSAGAWIYGTFELNNCNMFGTTTTETDCTPYDVAFVNHSKGAVNGGEYGSMFVYTMSEVALKGVKAGKIACMTNTVVGKALTIDKTCVIDTIEFVGSNGYVMNIVIENGAKVGTIIYGGNTYTVDTWNTYISSLGN